MARNFMELLRARWAEGKFLCVGLDSAIDKVQAIMGTSESEGDALYNFNRAIIKSTAEYAGAFKPNRAFYARCGRPGAWALTKTIRYIREAFSEIPVIFDAKEGDIDNTNMGYIEEAFDDYMADAVTVHNYMGMEAMRPFLDQKDKGIIVLVRTSNKGADEFQNLRVSVVDPTANGDRELPLYQYVAERVRYVWNYNGNCAVVVGATAPAELKEVRRIVGNMPILLPGIGAQGGDVQQTVEAGQDENGQGMIINASRSIIFASSDRNQFASAAGTEAYRLHNLINQYRRKAA